MDVRLKNDGGRLVCQSVPSLEGDPQGRTIEFGPTPISAVNAIKASVYHMRQSIKLLQFDGLNLQPLFSPSAYWIFVQTPRLRKEGMNRAASHPRGRNNAGELVTHWSRPNPINPNCHEAVRQWASLEPFFSGKRGRIEFASSVEFLNCRLPGEHMRLQLHLMYIWGGPVISIDSP